MRELEARFAAELVVVGVHSGKFRAERVTANIAQAVARLDVRHAVVNDRQYRIWRSYEVGSWPTIVLIDAEGGLVRSRPGEFLADELEPTLQTLVAEADARGVLDRSPSPLVSYDRSAAPFVPHTWPGAAPPAVAAPDPALLFPGKVLAVPGARLFVADGGHHRVLELELSVDAWRAGAAERPRARLRRVVGSGRRGRADGPLGEAALDRPLGMALCPSSGAAGESGMAGERGETLYVADGENHVVWAVALDADGSGGRVATLAGSGLQAGSFNESGVGAGVALSSPWDLALDPAGEALIVAMAGFHQLWRIDLGTLEASPWVGTGREDLSDGPAHRCTLAQPSGVHLVGDRVFVADTESSAVRVVEPGRHGPEVRTIVGKGLFEFGDDDGQGGHVRLQHDYGVTAGPDGLLYVADTYNNKIKRIDPATGHCQTLLGSGEEGARDGAALEARFDEPEGVSEAGGLLFVADTNNHAVRVTDLREGGPRHGQVATLEIEA